jgi:hypothetical protein
MGGAEEQLWDPAVLADILSLEYTQAVLFTDGTGQILYRESRVDADPELAELCDTMLGAVSQAGLRLDLGELTVTACLFQNGTIVAARSRFTRTSIFVLARSSGNLGQLFNQVRRVFMRGLT